MVVERGPDGCKVIRAWEGLTAVCIASGPSLTKEQVDRVQKAQAEGVKVGVVNDNYLIAPWADLLYFADLRWWNWHKEGLPKRWPWASFSADEVRNAFVAFKGQKISIDNGGNSVTDKSVCVLKNHGGTGLSDNPTGIHTGSNSGYQLLNIMYLAGVKKIILVGYDMKFDGNRSHSHDGHKIKVHECAYKGFGRNFSTTKGQLEKAGVQVLNATPGSTISAFPKVSLEEALKDACVQSAA